MPYVKKDATMYTHSGTTVSGDFRLDRVEKKVMTADELYINQSPNTNYEMSKTLLLQRALDKGFVTCVGPNRYEVNHNYELMWCNYNRPADGPRFTTREELSLIHI